MIYNNKEASYLADLDEGQKGIILAIDGGNGVSKRLADLGLSPGTEIRMLRKTLFSGPIQTEICGSKLVLGRGLASKIVVEIR
jgi:Fe2+ transport system protein FeoA